ncbi:hypothetical protein EZJ19_13805 [Parasulfuritortus cantonensis]|uniref:histidine kinase n=1 Tax=Parasulfuritortus cantonensis TaxID=2528202 RepID=A0A4R1B337_9PROT|nr:hypothetical protein EZJ19_13805 [Parasulfuritortus cantonensis]
MLELLRRRWLELTQHIGDLETARTELQASNRALSQARDDAEAASQAKTAFLTTMSHEVRTPLNAILGMAALLRGSRLDANQQAHVEALHRAGTNLLGLLTEVLDFTRLEVRPPDEMNVVFDPARLLREIALRQRAAASAKGLRLEVADHLGTPCAWWALRTASATYSASWSTTPSSSPTRAGSASAWKPGRAPTAGFTCAWRWPTPASAWARKRRPGCSIRSRSPTRRPSAAMPASASASPSANAWRKAWAAISRWPARRAWAALSPYASTWYAPTTPATPTAPAPPMPTSVAWSPCSNRTTSRRSRPMPS